MFNFNFLNDIDNYEDRKVEKTEPEDNNGIGVSTCNTSDEGYETAILDANGIHPVERYATKELAVEGHKKWVSLAKNKVVVKKIGCSDMEFLDEMITLEKVSK